MNADRRGALICVNLRSSADRTMASLNEQPGSSTSRQRCKLHSLKRRKRWTDDDLHVAIGADSTTKLSAKQASDAIARLGGGDLPNPPGQAPRAYTTRATPGATRMITDAHVEQIHRLLNQRFPRSHGDKLHWLKRNFKVTCARDLATAQRAGEVIRVLKDMAARPKQQEPPQ